MIVLKTLKWSNIFSYGKDNTLDLNANSITQVLGVNGVGKSSIPLILEEVLFNKNSKGIKRGDVLNRNVSDKKYFISLEFEKITEIGTEVYLIEVQRGTNQSVKLSQFVGGLWEDLSSHTSTATYKNIENLLGFDQGIFTSLIYQSSAQSMQFLTSTDTVRKKFLIELLGLTKYTESFEVFKEVSKEVAIEVAEVETKVSTVQKWLDINLKVDLTPGSILDVPEEPRDLSEELGSITSEIKNIEETNKAITKNNQYGSFLASIELDFEAKKPAGNSELITSKANLEAEKRNALAEIKKAKELKDTCPTCKQKVADISFVPALIAEKEAIVRSATEALVKIQVALELFDREASRFTLAEKKKQEFETYSSLYNSRLPSELKDKNTLMDRVDTLRNSITTIEAKIKEVSDHNNKVLAKNAKIEVIIAQSADMQAELTELSSNLVVLSDRLAILEILKKAFSTNGLLAYKLECLVKDLEDITNKYLGDLSGGRFQISFVVVNDKLNVVINDNGVEIDISALSSGEKSRVNTATLLAIRKLMQALSSTRVNLLILDETIDSLDADGKEKLIEVLLNEPELNTFLISHGYTHPLLEKITVVKENNISRLE